MIEEIGFDWNNKMSDTYDLQTTILLQADDFAETYYRCVAGENFRYDENGRLCSSVLNIPAIINAAFACELYMKSIIGKKIFGHNLKILFDNLNQQTQANIRKRLNLELEKRNYDFDTCLENIANVFKDWRYIFENEHSNSFMGNSINKCLVLFELLIPTLKECASNL